MAATVGGSHRRVRYRTVLPPLPGPGLYCWSLVRLLERAEHLGVLGDLLGSVDGFGRLALVSGEAGVGKSALVDVFCELQAATGTRVLSGRCDDLFAPRPLAPLSDIARQVGGPLRLALDRGDQPAAFDAFLDLVSSGPRPQIVVLEDLQWADDATLDLLRFTARRLDQVGCLLIGTHRDDVALDHPLRRAIGSLTGPDVHRLHLSRLSVESVRALAAGRAIDPVALHEATGGNPFFVVQVLAGEPWAIPTTVRDAVLARVAALSRPSRDALAAAAVLGAQASTPRVMALAGCDFDALEACVTAGLLDDHGVRLAFRHDLSRAAVEESLTPWRRRTLHAAALRVLGDEVDVVELAHHAIAAGDDALVLRLAPLAAERCSALGARRAAVALYDSAVALAGLLPDDAQLDLYQAHARACELAGRYDHAIDSCLAALRHIRQLDDPRRLGSWLTEVVVLLGCSASADLSEPFTREALTLLEPFGDTHELARALQAGAGCLSNPRPGEVEEMRRRALSLAERFGDEELAIRIVDNMGSALAQSGEERGFELLREALGRADAAGSRYGRLRACNNLGNAFNAQWRPNDALPYLEHGVELAREEEFRLSPSGLLSEMSLSLQLLGRWDEAAGSAHTVLADPELSRVDRAYTLGVLACIRVRRGDPGWADLLDEATELLGGMNNLQLVHPLVVARIEGAWLAGAVSDSCAATRHLVQLHRGHDDMWRRGELALWCHRAGVEQPGPHPTAEPFALHIAGRHHEAAAAWNERGCRYQAADALGDSDDESDLRAALEILHELAAAPRAAQVARRLQALGVPSVPRGPRASTRANPAGLTTRETEVAVLLAEGLSNQEIASRLVVSARTIDHHVSAVLAKLAVPSRRHVAAALAAVGRRAQDGEPVAPT